MKVLLTGSSGLLGRSVYQLLRKKKWDVIPLVRQPATLENEIVVDFDSPTLFQTVESISPCQAIIHLASRIDFSNQLEEKDFYGATINTTAAFINLAKKWNAHLIFSSSVAVYEPASKIILNGKIQPASAYASTKWLAERLIQASDLEKFTIFRYAGIYGLTRKFHLALNKFLLQALENAESPTVYGSGNSHRNYLYAKDAAQMIISALEKDVRGVHLAAGKETLNIKQMAEKICEVFLPHTSPRHMPAAGQETDYIVNGSDAFSANYNFEAALYDIVADYKGL